MNIEQTINKLKVCTDASPVCTVTNRAQVDDLFKSKLVDQPRGEKTGDRPDRMSIHSVFVISLNGLPLTPTTPAKARKLLKNGVAKGVWSKFGIFGIQLLTDSRKEVPKSTLGIDHGTKFEGYSVVIDKENNINVKLDLPNKEYIKSKIEERRHLRRSRRFRKCRRRLCRFNRKIKSGFISPSQRVIVNSRLKIIKEFCRIYPISIAAIENVCFNHNKYRYGKNFSCLEVGKNIIRRFLIDKNITIIEFNGKTTQKIRKSFGYNKITNKSKDCFESHCCDSLSLACYVGINTKLNIGKFLVVDDTYRPVRRKLHDSKPSQGGIRQLYSKGTVFGLRKGLLIGTKKSVGKLCGSINKSFRYLNYNGHRNVVSKILWISSGFFIKKV